MDGRRPAGRSELQREPDVQEDALCQAVDGEHVADRGVFARSHSRWLCQTANLLCRFSDPTP